METRLDLQPLWQCPRADGRAAAALHHPWGAIHRPDWAERGLIIWPRGGQSRILRLDLACPDAWRDQLAGRARARLALRWWAEDVILRVDGATVHRGDLFDTACRWPLPECWWQGRILEVELELRSPLHDDGALIHSHLDLEPLDASDPLGLLRPLVAQLEDLRRDQGHGAEAGPGALHWLGHAHLDLAWLWPVADTWRAAERSFESVLALMERFADLRFGHSTPALYAWLEKHRPSLYQRIRVAMEAGRFEPLNGPWVETDAVLIATASLLRQFQEGQRYSRSRFPEWDHALAWLPDSFGFGAGLPAVARATGVRWFCTHKLAWNATNPFPHRLFRWRSRCGSEVLALMTAPIGTDADPVAMERYRLQWQAASGVADALWLPGVGDHGGGPSAEMLEQLALWRQQSAAAPQRPGSLRDYLAGLEPLAPGLPVWRDELFLELHRGCATSRPDQKRHNRSLERLLREAELARVLAGGGVAGSMVAEPVAPGPLVAEAMLPGPMQPAAIVPGPAPWEPSDTGGMVSYGEMGSSGAMVSFGEMVPSSGMVPCGEMGPSGERGPVPPGEIAPSGASRGALPPDGMPAAATASGGRPLQEADLEAPACPSPAAGSPLEEPIDWRALLFQQFHDILPGTAIPEVYDQAESQWRGARRRARRQRDQALWQALGSGGIQRPPDAAFGSPDCSGPEAWAVVQLQPLPAAARTLRLPAGCWSLEPDGVGAPIEAAAGAGPATLLGAGSTTGATTGTATGAATPTTAGPAAAAAVGAEPGTQRWPGVGSAAAAAVGPEPGTERWNGVGSETAAETAAPSPTSTSIPAAVAAGSGSGAAILPSQGAPGGGVWLQLPPLGGVSPLRLRRWRQVPDGGVGPVRPISHPVRLRRDNAPGDGGLNAGFGDGIPAGTIPGGIIHSGINGETGDGFNDGINDVINDGFSDGIEAAFRDGIQGGSNAWFSQGINDKIINDNNTNNNNIDEISIKDDFCDFIGDDIRAASRGATGGGVGEGGSEGFGDGFGDGFVAGISEGVSRKNLDASGSRWRLENGLIGATIGPAGVEQLWDGQGRPLLAGPLEWRRWRDQGEFWDAWDIAANYRDHPLPWTWSGAPRWREWGPLCASFVWRGHCGRSPVRLEGRLLAGSPWLELVLQVRWRQRHELLRLEVPLAQPACRWAADTCGGVIERPAIARNPREESRWEVPAISWIAAVAQPGGTDLAVLLDGPQGVSGQAERLGVSLLRGPTWPDPGADNGLQRQRLALMACPSGWRPGAAPAQAQRFREPLWCRPLGRRGAPRDAAVDAPIDAAIDAAHQDRGGIASDAPIGPSSQAPTPRSGPLKENPTAAPNGDSGSRRSPGETIWPTLPPLAADLQLVSLRPAAHAGEALLAIQNLGPCRRQLDLGPHWLVLARCDGSEQDQGQGDSGGPSGAGGAESRSLTAIGPWQLAFWRVAINPRGHQRDR